MTKINPFKPNDPVPTAMFAGRYDELIALEKGLYQTKHGQNCNFLITGERGIGKSSLLMFLKYVATGDIESLEHGKFNFVSIPLVISDKTDLTTFIKLIEKNISREIGKIEKVRGFLADTWSFVQRLKIMDSGIDKVDINTEIDLVIDDFAYSVSETCKRITNTEKGEKIKDGIVFLIDEADNACTSLRLGYFFKVVTELLQHNKCNNVMFLVSGLPDVVDKLVASHESSVRIFSQIKIQELNEDDRKYVIDKGLDQAEKLNSVITTITNSAKAYISQLSEGYPHFIQQFAYSAFDQDSDDEITNEDVIEGAFKKGGAIDAIGDRYYVSAFHDKIKSDEYRQVLSIMAEKMNSWIKKSEIREKFTGDEATLSNALQALTTRKIILKNPSKIGEYRLQQRGFALWIKLFGDRKK